MDKSKPPTVPPGEQPATVDLHTLADSLTPAQRSGRACITCGATGTRLKPLGQLLTAVVAECDTHQWRRNHINNPAAWLTSCPPWCTNAPDDGLTLHRAADHPDERHHAGTYLNVEPRVCLGSNEDTNGAVYYLTLSEARRLRDVLGTLLTDATEQVAAGRSEGAL